MEEVKQSLQETASQERESYKSVFLKKRSVCNWKIQCKMPPKTKKILPPENIQ